MEIKLPFTGFYNSIWTDAADRAADRAEEQHVELLAEEYWLDEADVAQIIYYRAKYSECYTEIAKAFVPAFETWLKAEYGLKIGLEFVAMESPKEYNFETDRIFASISEQHARTLYGFVGEEKIRAEAKAQFTSRPGFISFYPSDIDEWGDLVEWDHNQLGVILDALVDGKDFEYELLDALYEEVDQAFDGCVDWDRVHYELKCLAGEEEPDNTYFPKGGDWTTQGYVAAFCEINHLKP